MQIGIHHIDNLLYLLGDAIDVLAMLARLETRAEIEDVGSVLLRFKSGAIGFVCADYISADRFEITVSGTKGIVRFDLQNGVRTLDQGANVWKPEKVEANDYLRAEMEEAGYLPIPKRLAQAGVKDMVRISDARMSGTAFGTIVLHIAPEAAVGGPLAAVQNGDRIRLSVAAKRIDPLVEEAEIKRRLQRIRLPAGPARGYCAFYRRTVLQANEGCDFDFLK